MTSNLLLKAYLRADQFLVDRASEAVKAWNYVTGRSRADLANIFNTAGCIISVTGIPIIALLPLWGLYWGNKTNKMIDENVKRTADGRPLLKDGETLKKDLVLLAPLTLAGGAVIYPAQDFSHNNPYTFNSHLLGIGFFTLGAGNYIMRADYQKPRKSRLVADVKKGLEGLARGFKQPIPEIVRTGGYE